MCVSCEKIERESTKEGYAVCVCGAKVWYLCVVARTFILTLVKK